jgi:hypothetical protein
MRNQILITLTLTLILGISLLLTIPFLHLSLTLLTKTMPSANPTDGSSRIPISVTISQVPTDPLLLPTTPSILLCISLTNTSPSPIYILTSASPLDPVAASSGLFIFTSLSTGAVAPNLGIKASRLLPVDGKFRITSRGTEWDDGMEDRALRIAGGGTLEKYVLIGAPAVTLLGGRRYEVVAKGKWMGVWVGEEAVARDGEGEYVVMDEGKGWRKGVFETEGVVMEVPV